MAVSEQEMGTILSVISKVDDPEQIRRCQEALRTCADRVGRRNMSVLKNGDRVYFINSKTGVKHVCVVEKVKQVWVEAREEGKGLWNVRATQLVRMV